MRIYLALMAATALTACGGAGPNSAGSAAVGPGTPPATPTTPVDTFVTPTTTKTYQAQGAFQSYKYDYVETLRTGKIQATDPTTGAPLVDGSGNPIMVNDPNNRTVLDAVQSKQLYVANAATVRSPGVTVTYDPRNAEFTLNIAQAGLSQNIHFQDPAHRTNFGGATKPQDGVPNLEINDPAQWRTKGVQYLEVDSGSTATSYDVTTFFYELPGTTTSYVTYAGYVRNYLGDKTELVLSDSITQQISTVTRPQKLDRGAFVFGQQTATSAVPTTGSGTFSGNMIASMVNNPDFDTDPAARTYYQWISGTANVAVNFQTGAVATTLAGVVGAPYYDPTPVLTPSLNGFPPPPPAILAGSTFSATSTGQIDLVATGGFTGTFSAAAFAGASTAAVDIVGSSLDGAFYGPAAQEVGASFRIVGGVPDQRVDIIGAFTGKKQ